MSSNDWIAVGRVGRPHGLNGAFFVEHPSEAPERFAVGAALHIAREPATVVESKRSGGRPVIRLDREVERGAALEVRRSELPPPEEDSYYVFELIGMAVEQQGSGMVGRVQDVNPGVANDVLMLDSGFALPLVDACVLDIDRERRVIVIAPGFVDAG